MPSMMAENHREGCLVKKRQPKTGRKMNEFDFQYDANRQDNAPVSRRVASIGSLVIVVVRYAERDRYGSMLV